ncbi:MAG: DEAD/DEAH box helicase, partial [Gemmatimonadota bacterium]
MTPAQALDHIARKTALTAGFSEVVSRLTRGDQSVPLHGLPTGLAAFLLTHVQRSLPRPLLVVAADEDAAEQWRDDLQAIAGEEVVRYLPAWDMGLYDRRSPSQEISGLRIEAVARLARREPTIVVAPVAALLTPVIPPHALELATLVLRTGAERPPDEITSHLVDSGFERVPMVDGVGQFSLRGGILDIFSFGAEHPWRLEFLGDEVESIRRFDVSTQRSIGTCESVEVLPARELVLNQPLSADYLDAVETAAQETGVDLSALRDQLELGHSLEGIEVYMAVLYGRDRGLFEYLASPVVYTEEADDLEAGVERALKPSLQDFRRHAERGTYLPPDCLVRDGEWLRACLGGETRLQPAPLGNADGAVRFGAREPRQAQGELTVLRHDVAELGRQDYEIHILAESQGQRHRLEEICSDWTEQLSFDLGTLHRGFVYPEARVALLNDHEIFSRQRQRYRYRRFKTAKPIATYEALQVGDFVVHVDHGIGRYMGIRRLELGGREHDCLAVAYQSDDKVFVPVEQLDRLRKYSSSEGDVPVLNRLGTSAWEKLKERTKEEIFKMAGELVKLYAERKSRPGFSFSTDSPMMRELEASFPFQETPDQQRAVEEVKGDMESASPMDRLVCGDVGYGKTEVAVRAAYKAVCDGKQVAVLVPTTILAQQHYETFTERMAHTPARIEVLSRFRTARQQKGVVDQLRQGKVDILIGTHRILSKDIHFRDLGLLVIDEEQRFGVKHKE